jgi:hypothetical protein
LRLSTPEDPCVSVLDFWSLGISRRARGLFRLRGVANQALGTVSETPIARRNWPASAILQVSRYTPDVDGVGNWHVSGCLGLSGENRQLNKSTTAIHMRGGITERDGEMDLNLGLPPDCTFEKNPIIVLFRCSYLGKETSHIAIGPSAKQKKIKTSFPRTWRRRAAGRHFCCCEKHPTCRKLKSSQWSHEFPALTPKHR